MNRLACQAGFFYPNHKEECCRAIKACMSQENIPSFDETIVAGIVPHAGWSFSGPTAAKVYQCISLQEKPDIFILFGAIHVRGIDKAALWKEGTWQSPLGLVEIDKEFSEKLLESASFWMESNPQAHNQEHSLEVQIPFLQYFFPEAKIVPILVPPYEEAIYIGKCAAKLAIEENSKKIVAIGSTDMTHYGHRFYFSPIEEGKEALDWVKNKNDKSMIERISHLEEDKIIQEARENNNACGAGAIAATVAFAKAQGKKSGKLLEYTTSWDVCPDKKIDTFVGYSSFIF